jgi:hypothetical protein
MRLITIAVAAVLCAGAAAAQESPPRGVARVFVQLADGSGEIAGHLLDPDPAGATLLVNGVRRSASIGASVDALIPGRTTIYRKTPAYSLRSAGLRPVFAMKLRF